MYVVARCYKTGARARAKTGTKWVHTFKNGELGTGVDLPHTVAGRAFVHGLVPVGPQGLDA